MTGGGQKGKRCGHGRAWTTVKKKAAIPPPHCGSWDVGGVPAAEQEPGCNAE